MSHHPLALFSLSPFKTPHCKSLLAISNAKRVHIFPQQTLLAFKCPFASFKELCKFDADIGHHVFLNPFKALAQDDKLACDKAL
jgi:hypothetical protein